MLIHLQCGAVASIRKWGAVFTLWNSDKTNREQIQHVQKRLKSLFGIPDVRYSAHESAMQKNNWRMNHQEQQQQDQYDRNRNRHQHQQHHLLSEETREVIRQLVVATNSPSASPSSTPPRTPKNEEEEEVQAAVATEVIETPSIASVQHHDDEVKSTTEESIESVEASPANAEASVPMANVEVAEAEVKTVDSGSEVKNKRRRRKKNKKSQKSSPASSDDEAESRNKVCRVSTAGDVKKSDYQPTVVNEAKKADGLSLRAKVGVCALVGASVVTTLFTVASSFM